MSAKDEIRELINGLDEAACQRLLDGVDVYGPGAFVLSIYSYVEAAKEPRPVELDECNYNYFIKDVGPWVEKLERTDTPVLKRLRGTR